MNFDKKLRMIFDKKTDNFHVEIPQNFATFRKPPARANGHTHECVSSELDPLAYH